MKIELIKNSHSEFTMICSLDGEVVMKKTQSTKDFLRHDIMHYCVEKLAGLKNSFFGRLMDDSGDEIEIMQTERVVGILQGLDKDEDFDEQKYNELLRNVFVNFGEKIPDYLSSDFINMIRSEYLLILNNYKNMKTGEDSKIILEFIL